MLTRISIQGFKSISKIDLELGKVNVFIGANGSGKTNLLEAVGMLGAAVSGEVDSESLDRRGVRLSPFELYKTNLRERSTSNTDRIVFDASWNHSFFRYHVSLATPIGSSDSWSYDEDDAEALLHEDKNLLKDLPREVGTKWGSEPLKKRTLGGVVRFAPHYKGEIGDEAGQMIDFLRDYAIFTPSTPVLRGLQPDINPRDPVGLLGGRLAEAVEDILDLERETLGDLDLDDVLELLDWVESFRITTPSRELLSPDVPALRSVVEFRDYWMGEKRNRISGYDASEGSLYVLFTLVLTLHPRSPRFFAIDNFGQTLNPRLERALMHLFYRLMVKSKPPRQVLLTTHNPLVLDGLDLRDDDVRLFAVERNQSTRGATEISRVELSKKALQMAENGTPLSQMWVMGLLGGVPDI